MSNSKLTKKQKKSIAFRERKSSKHKSNKNASEINDDDGFHDLPETEDANWIDEEDDEHVVEEQQEAKGKEAEGAGQEKSGKKRKREAMEESDQQSPTQEPKKKKNKDSIQRFILFIGNLKYTTTKEAIAAHFADCGTTPPSIRLLQPKAKPAANKPVTKSKGCAFLEFTEKSALQQALKLHQSELDGRKINVELTAGGGGNSEARVNKLKERNKGLFSQRKNNLEKQLAKDKDGDNTNAASSLQRPQRYSSTSGVASAPQKRRTWSIAEADDGEVHRGGIKHKGKKHRTKSWGTGANATPVG